MIDPQEVLAAVKNGQVPLVTNVETKNAILAEAQRQGVQVTVGHSSLGFHIMAVAPDSIQSGRTEVILD